MRAPRPRIGNNRELLCNLYRAASLFEGLLRGIASDGLIGLGIYVVPFLVMMVHRVIRI